MAHPMTTRMWHGRKPIQKELGKYHTSFSTPWAVAGMVTAFAGGALLGMLGGKKAAMAADGDQGEGMTGSGWFRKHHHHDLGSPACRTKHDLAAPGAAGEKVGERNEGE